MRNAYKHLVKYAIAQGHTISVYDGEEWAVKRSKKQKEIIAAVESVEEAEIRIRDVDGNYVAWASVIPFGVNPDEAVSDFSDNEYMKKWFDEFEAGN